LLSSFPPTSNAVMKITANGSTASRSLIRMNITRITTTHTTAIVTCCWRCVVFLKPLDYVSTFVSEDESPQYTYQLDKTTCKFTRRKSIAYVYPSSANTGSVITSHLANYKRWHKCPIKKNRSRDVSARRVQHSAASKVR
jgi:hypothetical protein